MLLLLLLLLLLFSQSASAPVVAGMISLVNAARRKAGKGNLVSEQQ